jgi:hypothetical protein
MTRWFLSIVTLLVLALIPGRADAAAMMHYDLAGLLLQSESVVVAERIADAPSKPHHGSYQVLKVLRGPAKVGAVLELYDGLFDRAGIDREVVLFLAPSGGLVSSGMRVFIGGRAFRFEQWSNPGGWHMVPQGDDPIDQWRPTPQLDRPGLDKAIAAAAKRIAAFDAAILERDPAVRRAAVLALFAPPGTGRSNPAGFYYDLLAERARTALGTAGDIEGALLVAMRDRGTGWRRSDFAPVADLLAIAADGKRAVDLRITALTYARDRLADDAANLRAVVTLVDDADPRMRAAAVELGGGVTQSFSSDAAYNRRIAAFKADLMNACVKRFARDTDPGVLTAIAAVYTDLWKSSLPPRTGGPAQFGRARLLGTVIDVDVRCTTPIRADGMRVLATSRGVTTPVNGANVWLHCGGSNGVSGGLPTTLAAGRYDLAVELGTKPRPTTLPLGTLVVDVGGDMRLEP